MGGTGGWGGTGGNAAITGSHDLEFANIQVSSNPYGMKSPSEGATVRIDIRKLPGGYVAAATPRWGDPSSLSIVVNEKSVTLTGSVRIRSGGSASDDWTKLVVQRDAQGRLVGPISGTGKETIWMGDVVDMRDITGGGKIGPDVTTPELKSSPRSSHGPGNMLLPWDPIVLHAAEGVDQGQLRSHVSIDPAVAAGSGSAPGGPSGAPSNNLSVVWQLSPSANDKLGWIGATNATARIGDWSLDGNSFALMVDAGVRDPAGHSAGAFNTTFTWLSIGARQSSINFDSSGLTPGFGLWGKAYLKHPCPPGAACAGPLLCESGGCAVLGPFDNTLCGAPRLGIAGRLYGGAKLVLRYRVLLGADYPGASSPPSWGGTPFSVDIATPGHAAKTHSVNVDAAKLKPLPSPIGQLRWATGFKTLTLPASSASEVGFAVFGGTGPGNCGGGGGPMPAPVPTAVIIDSVTIQ